LLKADRSTKRREPSLPTARKSKAKTPVELLVEASQTRRK